MPLFFVNTEDRFSRGRSPYDFGVFILFLIKAYVVGSQKNHLNETVLLGIQNIC